MQGLGPGYRFKTAFTAGSLPEQGGGQAIGVGRSFRRSQGLGTDIPETDGALRISFDLYDPTRFDLDDQAAASVVHSGTMGLENSVF